MNAYFQRKHAPMTTRRTIKQVMAISNSSTPLQQEFGSAKPCAPEGRAQPMKACLWAGPDVLRYQRNLRLTRGPHSSDDVECSHSDWVRPSVNKSQPNLRGRIPRHATTQFEQNRVSEAHTDNDFRLAQRPEQTLVIAVMGCVIPAQRTGGGSLPWPLLLCTPGCLRRYDPAPQVNRL